MKYPMRWVRMILFIPLLSTYAPDALGGAERKFQPLKNSKTARSQKTAEKPAAERPARANDLPFRRSPAANGSQRHFDGHDIPRLSLGVAYTGVQVRGRLGKRIGVESRYMWNKTASDFGDITTTVLGGRLYLFSRPTGGFTFFGGAEGASLSSGTNQADTQFKGFFTGGFIGLEYRLSRRFSWGMDVGYYQLSYKNSGLSIDDSGSGIVLNSFLNLHVL